MSHELESRSTNGYCDHNNNILPGSRPFRRFRNTFRGAVKHRPQDIPSTWEELVEYRWDLDKGLLPPGNRDTMAEVTDYSRIMATLKILQKRNEILKQKVALLTATNYVLDVSYKALSIISKDPSLHYYSTPCSKSFPTDLQILQAEATLPPEFISWMSMNQKITGQEDDGHVITV